MSIIFVPSEARRSQMAEDASARHDALKPMPYKSRGVFKCCGVLPEYRNGGAVLGSFACPICKRREGVWSCNFQIILNNWNGNTYRATWNKENPVPKEVFLKSIDGYEEGWRFIPNINFNTRWNHFKGNTYYSSDVNHSYWLDVIMRYDVNTNDFEFYNANKEEILKIKFNPPKSGGGVSYGIPNSCILDNEKQYRDAPIHTSLSFHSNNHKWDGKVMEIYEFLKI